MRVVQPVNFLDELVGFRAETDRCDVQILKALRVWICNQFLSFNRHELRGQPSAEELAIKRLPPRVMVVFKCLFKRNCSRVWLDLRKIEEHLVDFLIGVRVWSSQVIGLADCLLHLQAVHDS